MSTRPLRTFVLVLVVLVSSASTVHAQCAFSHTGAADTFESGFVAGFLGCAGSYTHGEPGNDMTEGGLESCSPPSTYTEVAGSPLNGWSWNESTGSASIRLSRTRNRLVSALNPPGDTKDVRVKLRMSGVLDGEGFASGAGGLWILARVTFDDRTGGDMTVVDVPMGFPFTLENGRAALDTSMNVWWDADGHPGFPPCTSLEILSIRILDENGDFFASAGSFVTPKTNQDCGFAHPKKAGKFEASFVPALYACGNLPGAVPNGMTESNIPSCSPPQTFNERIGDPPTGWSLDPDHGKGRITITPKTAPYGLTSGAMNPDGQTGDLRVRLKLSGVRDQDGPANGIGTLSALATTTLRDRRGTATESDDTPMTLADLRFESAFTLTDGEANLDTSVDAMLNAIGQPGLPHCSSLELFAIELADQDGTTFAQLGTWLSP